MSAIEVVPDEDVEQLKETIREALKNAPLSDGVSMFCPVCERGFDPRGIAPHMDKHRRAIGDLPPRGKRGPNRPKVKQRTLGAVVIAQSEPDLRTAVRQKLEDRIALIVELENCAGIEEEFGEGTIELLLYKRTGLMIALEILDGL